MKAGEGVCCSSWKAGLGGWNVTLRGGDQGVARWTVWAFGVDEALGFTLSVARHTKQVT